MSAQPIFAPRSGPGGEVASSSLAPPSTDCPTASGPSFTTQIASGTTSEIAIAASVSPPASPPTRSSMSALSCARIIPPMLAPNVAAPIARARWRTNQREMMAPSVTVWRQA